ncbi:MAG: rod shape-determining protein MreD [Tenuifilaceae bacterium]|jgi:rod shape-determining protein MreD|uniref:rod shape-determining protein MreD n=1 Tax=Perlabentimonas gracilis TaxID=2715279 RepID=UPI0014088646|nr:rod shape-determining protein MreD [Perlabentimonas gracilis]MDX9769737.1 rod shape-determining protein MreD [Tenuifilaceae bacterium]NHB68390.1 rod shape-determining protein MreD [Perlabentimonas gracilis]
MVKDIVKYSGLFVLLILLQIFILNNIQLSGYINPYLYVLFILLLPYEIAGWALLIVGLLTGLTIDTFMNTYGMHSSATIFLAFLRPYMLRMLADREDVDKKGNPSLSGNGFVWFLKYVSILVFAHHLMLFFIEAFSFSTFFSTLWRTLLSSVTTTIFIFIAMLLFDKKQ